MIFIVIGYVIFLAFYLPVNFYLIYKVYDMRLYHDHGSTAINFLAAGIAVIVLISLITIAVSDWSLPYELI